METFPAEQMTSAVAGTEAPVAEAADAASGSWPCTRPCLAIVDAEPATADAAARPETPAGADAEQMTSAVAGTEAPVAEADAADTAARADPAVKILADFNLPPAPPGIAKRTALEMQRTSSRSKMMKRPAAAPAATPTDGKLAAAPPSNSADVPMLQSQRTPEKSSAAEEDADEKERKRQHMGKEAWEKRKANRAAAAAKAAETTPKKQKITGGLDKSCEKAPKERSCSLTLKKPATAKVVVAEEKDTPSSASNTTQKPAPVVDEESSTAAAPGTPAVARKKSPIRIPRRFVSSPDAMENAKQTKQTKQTKTKRAATPKKKSSKKKRPPTPMSAARKAEAEQIRERIKEEREHVKKINEKLLRVIEQEQIYMYSQAQGVLKIAEAVIGRDCSQDFSPLLQEIGGGEEHTMFSDAKCKMRLLSQRNTKIWQVVDAEGHSQVQCAVPVFCNEDKPLLMSEILLWLACAGYGKEALQRAKRIVSMWTH